MLEKLSQEDRTNLAFQLVVAMRDTISIANKKPQPPTYENAIRLLHDLSPDLYSEVIECLPGKNMNDIAKFYLSKADAESLMAQREITPIELINRDIDELKNLIENSPELDKDKKRTLENRHLQLCTARMNFEPRQLSEHRILQRDFGLNVREDFGQTFLHRDEFKADYRLTKNSYLRIRLLHPDKEEHITGADLIYEQHDVELNKFRVMFLQYKIWDDGVLYFSQGNLEAQLRKMQATLCNIGICNEPEHLQGLVNYRFPYCSAFLRPTDKLQKQGEKLVSSGIHIPVCSALHLKDNGEASINKKYIRHEVLNHTIFEKLFNKSFIGSRWLTEAEIGDLYLKNEIISNRETVKIYAREIFEEPY